MLGLPEQPQLSQGHPSVETEVKQVIQTTAAEVAATERKGKDDTTATPAASPATAATASDAATEQPRERRTRAARANAGLSMKAMMSEEQPQEQAAVHKEAPAPTEEEIRAKWPELALRYKHLDRLCSMLNTTTLTVTDAADGCKLIVFQVVNEAQRTWVEAKMLHDLEGNLRAILKYMKLYLRVEVTPDDTPQEKKIYMPSEQAGVLMKENAEVNSLVQDLGLDIK